MMTFEQSNTNWIATNSIKPVIIRQLEEDMFALDMPEGDLYVDFKIMNELFDTFEEAKKWAEHRVGMKMNLKDF